MTHAARAIALCCAITVFTASTSCTATHYVALAPESFPSAHSPSARAVRVQTTGGQHVMARGQELDLVQHGQRTHLGVIQRLTLDDGVVLGITSANGSPSRWEARLDEHPSLEMLQRDLDVGLTALLITTVLLVIGGLVGGAYALSAFSHLGPRP